MTTIHTSDHVQLGYDPEHHLCLVKWKGSVPTEEFKSVTHTGLELLEHHNGYSNILLDRSDLEEFSPESRIWLKEDIMKQEGKRLIKKVKKLAAVKPRTNFSNLMTKMFSAIFIMTNPNIEYRVFEDVNDALGWIKEETHEHKRSFLSSIKNLFNSHKLSIQE